MSSCENVEQFLLFLILDYLIAQFSLEGIDSCSRLEANFNVDFLSWIDCDRIAWNYLNKLLFQLLKLIINIKSNLYFFLTTTN